MIKRSVRVRLADMLEAVDGALEIVSGKSYDGYLSDYPTKRAIERCVEIVSEASRHVPEEFKAKHPEMQWDDIRAIGNRLRHEYQRVDDLIMWRIATRYFPKLKLVLLDLMRSIEQE